MRWLAQSVTEIAAQFFFSVAVIGASNALLPWTFATVPLMGITAIFASAFFYRSDEPVAELPPIFRDPKGRVNEGSNCAINAVVQCLRLDPRFMGKPLVNRSSQSLRAEYLGHVGAGQFDAREALDALLDTEEPPSDTRLISLDLMGGWSFDDALQFALPRAEHVIAPQAAWLHIKRFNDQGEKLDAELQPLEAIRIVDTNYRMKAFVVHRGSLNAGHYICYVDAGEGNFYCCDDMRIAWITQAQFRQAALQSYLLLYAQ